LPVYEPLRVRSVYSLARGTGTPAALAERAAGYGHRRLALTDRNNLYGAFPFVEACRDWGVHPILGAEIDGPDGEAVFLVRDAAGYARLCRLLTRRMLDPGFTLAGAVAREAPCAGLHVLAADPLVLAALKPLVAPGALWAELRAPGASEPGLRALTEAARTLDVDVVATPHVTTLAREDHAVHATLSAVRGNTLVARLRAGDLSHREAYFKTPAAVASLFRGHPRALRNTIRIAESCAYVPRRDRWIFPRLDLPDGETPLGYLRALCRGGFMRRYAAGTTAAHRAKAERRLEHELGVIDRLGFTDYFVIVGEIVQFAREQGIATVGRGSGAGALTAYLLGITNVDPVRYGLYFERFLHAKRADCPDIDVDLCWKRRDEVIDFVYRRYGRDRVAMISTHNTYGPRSAFREAAKAHGVAHAAVNRLCRAVPHGVDGSGLRAAIAASPHGREIPLDQAPWPRILTDAQRMLGMPRHLGVHPGGMVIADRPIEDYVPLEEATKGIVVTQFEMRAIEAAGLVKMDLLGNRALSTIQETVELVAERHGVRLDPDAFPDPDPATAAMFTRGDTLGVFQMESPGMRNLNRMLRTGDLAATIAAVALIRPGPAGSGMKERFVRCARGMEAPRYLDPRLEPVLRDTYGVPLYEEDVMRLAAAVAGLTLEDGDVFRRGLASAGPEQRAEMGRVFRREAVRRGFAPAGARAIWEQMLQFGAFAFCKAHAAGYGVLAWQAGWLKAHYPLEYAAALMNHHAGMYDKRVHLEDIKRRGLCVALPCVNRSADAFIVDGDAVRIGLERVRGLTERTRAALLAARPFTGVEDFLARVPAARPEAEALVLCGAFDFTGRTRPELLCTVAAGFDALRRVRNTGASGDLFSAGVAREVPVARMRLPEFSPAQRLWLEWDLLGLCTGPHPMTLFRPELPPGVLPAGEAERRPAGCRVRAAGLVAARRPVPTKNGELMQFLTLEDESGMIECTLFPRVNSRYRGLLRGLGPFLAEGRVEDTHGAPTLNVERLAALPLPSELAEAASVAVPAIRSAGLPETAAGRW